MSLLDSAISKYRRDGLVALVHSGFDLMLKYLELVNSGGQPTLSIGNNSITVKATNEAEINHVRLFRKIELSEVQLLLEKLEPNDVFYDIGANIGIYSLFANNECDYVVAFEPHPTQIERLRENAALNEAKIDVQEIAVSDGTGTAKLDATGNEPAGHGTASVGSGDEGGLSVHRTTVDSLTKGDLPSPDVVKIDVEGHEFAVLRGMERTLDNSECRALFIEVHKEVKTERLIDFLKTKGYTTQVNNDNGQQNIHAKLR